MPRTVIMETMPSTQLPKIGACPTSERAPRNLHASVKELSRIFGCFGDQIPRCRGFSVWQHDVLSPMRYEGTRTARRKAFGADLPEAYDEIIT